VPIAGWLMFAPEGFKAFASRYKKDIDSGKFTLVVADTLKMQLELLRDGYANALVGQRPFEMGEKAMDTLLALKKGEKVPDVIYTGLDLVTKDNVAKLLN
jgi:ribose transport system substrate-binding protein